MNIPDPAILATLPNGPPHGHTHSWRPSRRQLLLAGAATTATVVAAGVIAPLRVAAASDSGTPVPVLANPNAFGLRIYDVKLGMEPSSINNFKGTVGAAIVRGTGTGTNTVTGTESLIFDSDMRFMKGIFQGTDGRVHEGTFAFIWLDLYRGQFDPFVDTTHQITDNNPGFTSSGLLWTMRATNSAVDVDFDAGTARYQMSNVPMQDYGTLINALFGGGGAGMPGPSVPSTVSFDVRWSGVVRTEIVRDAAVGFAGTYKQTGAHLDWSMQKAGFSFQSDPTGQTTIADQPLLGHERNGVFFR